jgi:hypothetical protein
MLAKTFRRGGEAAGASRKPRFPAKRYMAPERVFLNCSHALQGFAAQILAAKVSQGELVSLSSDTFKRKML